MIFIKNVRYAKSCSNILKIMYSQNDDIMSRMMTNDDKMMTYYMMTSKHVIPYCFFNIT